MGGSTAHEPRDEQLRRLLDAVTDGLALCREGTVVWANRALASLCGVDGPEELVDRPFEQLFRDAGQGLPQGRAGDALECGLAAPEPPTRVWIETLEADESGKEAVFRVRNVTELRAAQSEAFEQGRSLHAAERERAALRDRLQREYADREELLTVVSHELRTPVTVIAGYNRLLLSERIGPLNPEQRRFLTESQKSCQRLNLFIANLLEQGRARLVDGILELHEAPLAPAVDAVVGLFEPLLEERGLRVGVRLEPGLWARFDPPRLEQVLTNLLGNAARFARPGGTIEVEARAVGPGRPGFVEVAVADDGPGIPPEDRERIFQPYVRAGETRSAGGLGLGLAICKRLVVAHGGTIRVEERPGGGSCFRFTLPGARAGGGWKS